MALAAMRKARYRDTGISVRHVDADWETRAPHEGYSQLFDRIQIEVILLLAIERKEYV